MTFSNREGKGWKRKVPQGSSKARKRPIPMCPFLLTLIGCLFCYLPSLFASETLKDLTELSLEALMNLKVTSVSKKEEALSQAPAAVFVITPEDIRRSGATCIPELLRMVPGLEVARIDANKWAVSARGFNSRFANKLLVLRDGRTLYSPLFSGVFWDVQDVLLEDIERIEVIRGPGATLWGANAVNGVINIITKQAKDAQGFLATGGTGSEEKGFGGVLYGTKVSEKAQLKLYGHYFARDGSVTDSGQKGEDAWDLFRLGFRLDGQPSGQDQLTVQGELYQGQSGSLYGLPTPAPPYMTYQAERTAVNGGHVLGRFQRKRGEGRESHLQFYYDRTYRKDSLIDHALDTFDLEWQNRFQAPFGQEIVLGLGYRLLKDRLNNREVLALNPPEQDAQLFSAFIQDEIRFFRNILRLVIGSKFEHNDYTGFEVQPSLRGILTPDAHQSLWAAVSR